MKTTAIILGVLIVILAAVVLFVNPVAKIATSSDSHVELSLPHIGDAVTSPLAIEGTVTGGGWFFEGSFPIAVLDGYGATIGAGTARALSDWMSSGTVPFSASIPFSTPTTQTGTIVLQNDNPSGDPGNARSLSVPIRFH